MKKNNNILPEYFLIVMGMVWIIQLYVSTGRIGYITLLATWLLFIQVFYKNKVCGIVYGLLFSLISIYKLLQGIIKYDDLPNAILQFVVFSITLVAGVAMFYKYLTAKEKYDESALTMTYE